MRTEAAVLREAGADWTIEEVELDPPGAGEVLVRVAAAGLCHSEEHHRCGDVPFAAPLIGGHEGAGHVEAIGPGVTVTKPGDFVVFSCIPNCGRCPSCAQGRQNLCDAAAGIMNGLQIADGTSRHHDPGGGADYRISCQIGCCARHTVVHEFSVIPADASVRPEVACVAGCGVPTGWGSSVYAGGVRPGDSVAVVGAGGLGSAAVQGARLAGARKIFAIDPVPFKREKALGFGATHTAESVTAAFDLIREVTWGRLCDVVVLTMGTGRSDMMDDIVKLAGKRGRIVVTNIYPAGDARPALALGGLGLFETRIVGCLFGSVNSRADIPRLLALYKDGLLDLDGMVTRTYPLDGINAGYQDMLDGKNIRGVLVMDLQAVPFEGGEVVLAGQRVPLGGKRLLAGGRLAVGADGRLVERVLGGLALLAVMRFGARPPGQVPVRLRRRLPRGGQLGDHRRRQVRLARHALQLAQQGAPAAGRLAERVGGGRDAGAAALYGDHGVVDGAAIAAALRQQP
ncbi:MAG: NDMA-dependent alcohol dehydrogenase, partial [Nocardiopsaceae bacterium]|nr:NDMA-dependent alcohol dehydrogenase [Nocardiopsaceae bacterium]